MSSISFSYGPKTQNLLEYFKSSFHMKTEADVFRRALSLLAYADQLKNEDGSIVIGNDEEMRKLFLDK